MYCHPSLQWPVYLHAAGNSITFAVITPGLHCVFKDQAVIQDYPSFQCAYVKLVFVAVIIPGLHSAFKCQAIIQDYTSFQCAYVQLSPWYNRTGWLGVKHQLTYLFMCNCYLLQSVITPGLYCAFRGQTVISHHPLLQCTYMQLVSVAVITPGLHCAFRGQAVMQDFTKGYFGHLIWPWKHTDAKEAF